MKIEVNEKAATKVEYPCLMISEEGRIVLFASYGKGVSIKDKTRKTGHWEEGWAMDAFTPFTGSVTLSND